LFVARDANGLSKIRLVLVVVVAAIVPCGESAYTDFTFVKPIEQGQPIWYQGDDPQSNDFLFSPPVAERRPTYG